MLETFATVTRLEPVFSIRAGSYANLCKYAGGPGGLQGREAGKCEEEEDDDEDVDEDDDRRWRESVGTAS